MNIFVLDRNPTKAAKYLCDKHISKMLVETAQLLCSAFETIETPYKRTHINHPCAIWTRESKGNFLWLVKYGEELEKDFQRRYHKSHKSFQVISWCKNNIKEITFKKTRRTEFPQVMPNKYFSDDIVKSYRDYYFQEKGNFCSWKLGEPDWWKQYQNL